MQNDRGKKSSINSALSMQRENKYSERLICYLLFYGVQLRHRKQRKPIYRRDEENTALASFTKITAGKTNHLKG